MAAQQIVAGNTWAGRLSLALAAVVLLAGVALAAFVMPADKLGLRVLVLAAALILAFGISCFSLTGKRFLQFARDSIAEVKKVVWPTRKETLQTTLAVFVFVVLMALFLWTVDKSLEWMLYDLILGWKRG